MNPLHTLQDDLVDEINKIPIIKKSIGDSDAIPVHKWRGSNLSNALEAEIKKIGFGIIVKFIGFNQSALHHWKGQIQIELNVNDMFTHGGWGKGVEAMTVAWMIARTMELYQHSGSTSLCTNIQAREEETQNQHLEKIIITAQVEWTMPQN